MKLNQPKISLLIPFSTTDPQRQANFNWLIEYWKHELPDAEVVIGTSTGQVFCKGEALNNAVSKSHGQILAIVDADAYIEGSVLDAAADLMLENLHNNLWFVPYRRLYRLNEDAAKLVTGSDLAAPYRFSRPVSESFISNAETVRYGNRYGAMMMMFPRQAYNTIRGFDERFKGWGGEDVCLLRALDTLYGKHKTMDADIFHLWHPVYGTTYEQRRWAGQDNGGSNWVLSKEYGKAVGKPSEMAKIIEDSWVYRLKKIPKVQQFINLFKK